MRYKEEVFYNKDKEALHKWVDFPGQHVGVWLQGVRAPLSTYKYNPWCFHTSCCSCYPHASGFHQSWVMWTSPSSPRKSDGRFDNMLQSVLSEHFRESNESDTNLGRWPHPSPALNDKYSTTGRWHPVCEQGHGAVTAAWSRAEVNALIFCTMHWGWLYILSSLKIQCEVKQFVFVLLNVEKEKILNLNTLKLSLELFHSYLLTIKDLKLSACDCKRSLY